MEPPSTDRDLPIQELAFSISGGPFYAQALEPVENGSNLHALLAVLANAQSAGVFSFVVSGQAMLAEPASLKFRRLANQWKRNTRFVSVLKRKMADPAYLKIIGMGKDALPFILKDLDDRPADWIPALMSITEENPVKPDDNFEQAVKAWLKWGRDHHLL